MGHAGGGGDICYGGDVIFLSPQARGAGGEPAAGSASVGTRWGQEVGRRGTVTPPEGCNWRFWGSWAWKDPSFCKGWLGGSAGCLGDLQPSPGSGCPALCSSVSLCPSCATGLPPCAPLLHRGCRLSHAVGCSSSPPRGARAASPSPRRALPRVVSAPLPWRAPVPARPPARSTSRLGPPGGPASARLRHAGGESPRRCLRLPACPALSPGGEKKKAMKILLYKKEKKNTKKQTHVKRILVFIINNKLMLIFSGVLLAVQAPTPATGSRPAQMKEVGCETSSIGFPHPSPGLRRREGVYGGEGLFFSLCGGKKAKGSSFCRDVDRPVAAPRCRSGIPGRLCPPRARCGAPGEEGASVPLLVAHAWPRSLPPPRHF